MSCSCVPYRIALDRWLSVAPAGRLPIGGSVEFTTRCNLACRHCYISRAQGQWPDPAIELDTDTWRGALDQVAEAGCLWLLITGGEPLLRPDFHELYRHAKQAGFFVTLYTNGTLLDDRVADLLAELPPYELEITLYGTDPAAYEVMTGAPWAHDAVRAALERLRRRELPVTLKGVFTTLNLHTLPAIRAFAAAYGAELRVDAELNAGADGGRQPVALRLSPEQVVAIDEAMPERAAALVAHQARFAGVKPSGDRLYQCGAGQRVFHVDPYGRVFPCLLDRHAGIDLRADGFIGAWSRLADVVSERWSRDVPCRTCGLFGLCSQCPGMARMEHGDPQAVVTYFCEIARRRAALAAAPHAKSCASMVTS